MAILALFWVVWQWPDGKIHLVFCDVGQGDAELIVKGEIQVLVDTGPSDSKLGGCLSNNIPFWDRTIEMVVVTHPQRDHMGALDKVLSDYKVGRLVVNGVVGKGEEWEEVIGLVKSRGVEIYVPEAGDVVRLGEVELTVLWPEEEVGDKLAWMSEDPVERGGGVLGAVSDVNEISIVMRLEYGAFTAMLTGDLGEKEEQALVGEGVITPVEVLKVAHHGSKYSSSREFLEAAKPKLAVIEVGESNSYGHPSGDTTKRFDAVGSRILRTDIDGEVEVVSDGEKWWVN